jgi:phosphoglycolate phosphatase-like HAD superfamily hydrolase
MKLFIWDFHGVLEKGNENSVWEISNLALKKLGFTREMSIEENNQLYGKKWFQYFEYLLPSESHETHLKLQATCLEIEEEKPELVSKHIKTNDYVFEILETISQKHHQILISNSHSEALNNFISLTKLNRYFTENNTFSTNSHLHPEKITKKDILINYLKDNPIFDEFVTIGDSPVDMEIVGKNQGKHYLYSHPHLNFRDCDADFKIHDLREVLKEI